MQRRRFILATAVATFAVASSDLRAHAATTIETASYLGAVQVIIGIFVWASSEASAAAGRYNGDLTDPEWRIDLLSPTAAAEAAMEQHRKLTPPAEFRDAHEHMDRGLEYMVLAGVEMRSGVLYGDVDAMERASSYMELSTEAIDEATAALPSFGG